jgi:hypothetical protein
MSKPIFIVKLPLISDTQQYERILSRLEEQLGKDYHVLCSIDNRRERFSFNIYNNDNNIFLY